ncbi:MAG: ATPase, T2SS/T4P/T4SS family [bacterium]
MDNQILLEIRRPGGSPVTKEVTPGTYVVGSDEDSRIVLPGPDVSGRHAVLSLGPDECWVEDLASHTGTFIDGRRVEGRATLLPGQELRIGPYVLVTAAGHSPSPAVSQNVSTHPAEPQPQEQGTGLLWQAGEPFQPSGPATSQQIRSIKAQIQEELVKRMNLKRITTTRIGEEDLKRRVMDTVRGIVAEVGSRLPADIKPAALVKEIYDEAVGLGPIEDLLADPEITEIMINGHDRVYVEKQGRISLTGQTFLDDASVLATIERIVSPLGRRIDESQPFVDARLKDGSRVNAIIHPLSLVGPCLTIRKFSKTPFTDGDMIRFGTMTERMAEFIKCCVLLRKNIVISGGTGSGKTSLLNVFSGYLPHTERIVTIEDAAELRLTQDHVIRLEARPPNIENKGAVTIRDLVRNSLRMRPDRIVVGECRGGEALDMLQAMNTGHDGSLTTVHANSPRDVVSRLETMVLMSGMDLPVRAIREQIVSAIHVIVHEARMADGTRKVTNISEVVGLEGDRVTMQDLFIFEQTGIDTAGKVLGKFMPCGTVPTFVDEFKRRGISLDPATFDPRKWGR